MGKKPQQRSPYKKWNDLSLKQREYVINEGHLAYKQERENLQRTLNKQEKYALIKKIKLRCWVPPNVLKLKMMEAFSHCENIIQRDIDQKQKKE